MKFLRFESNGNIIAQLHLKYALRNFEPKKVLCTLLLYLKLVNRIFFFSITILQKSTIILFYLIKLKIYF